jgi:hypothetical protein
MVERDVSFLKETSGCNAPECAHEIDVSLHMHLFFIHAVGDDEYSVLAHRLCALWCPRVYIDKQSGALMRVGAEAERARGLRCAVCSKSGG